MKRVLIVEDDFISRQLLMELLRKHFDTCHMAVNGLEAVEAFALSLKNKEPYDLICFDIMMPEMDGHTALQEVRKLEKGEGIGGNDMVKVVMTSALDTPKDIMGAFMKGSCEGFLTKPIDRDKLNDFLRKFDLYRK